MKEPIVERSRAVLPGLREIFLAGGCFWGAQAYLGALYGVEYTDVGYANGNTERPSYELVCGGQSGFAEAVRVVYDPQKLILGFLLEAYFESIDPISINRQGNDIGSQYRTGIYYLNEADFSVVAAEIEKLQKTLKSPVQIEAVPLKNYYLAEEYHQNYLEKNPGGYCHISSAKIEQVKMLRCYQKPNAEALRESLTELEYAVTQNAATEPAFKNKYFDHFEPGIYVDITTGQPLFSSTDKFESGCGWPAFSKPIDPADLEERPDDSFGMRRTEVRAKNSSTHLGHIFEDGPSESGGLRYCVNSAALRFVPKSEMQSQGYGYLFEKIVL